MSNNWPLLHLATNFNDNPELDKNIFVPEAHSVCFLFGDLK
jgi:hypothetical protein